MTGRAHKIQVQQEVQICVDYSHERIPAALVLPCTCQMKRSHGTRAVGRGGSLRAARSQCEVLEM